MKTKLSTRFLSLLLCVLMSVSLVPVTAFAEDSTWYCPECGRQNNSNFCPNDGTAKPADLSSTTTSGNMTAAGSHPSEQDIIDVGDKENIVLPKSGEYLASYETAYVNASKDHSIYVYWDYGKSERPFYAYHSDPVTVLARHGDYSCVLFTTDKNIVHAGWVYTKLLSDKGVEVTTLKADTPMQIDGKSLVYHRDDENLKCSLSYGTNTVDLEYNEIGYTCDVAMYGSDRFVVFVPQFGRMTVPVVYKKGKLTAYSAVRGDLQDTANVISLNRFILNVPVAALGCHESTITYSLLSGNSATAVDDSYFEFMDSSSVVSKIPLTLYTATGSVSLPAGSVMQPFALDTAKKQIFVWYNGQQGWFNCTESRYYDYCIDGKEAEECFDGLFYAG